MDLDNDVRQLTIFSKSTSSNAKCSSLTKDSTPALIDICYDTNELKSEADSIECSGPVCGASDAAACCEPPSAAECDVTVYQDPDFVNELGTFRSNALQGEIFTKDVMTSDVAGEISSIKLSKGCAKVIVEDDDLFGDHTITFTKGGNLDEEVEDDVKTLTIYSKQAHPFGQNPVICENGFYPIESRKECSLAGTKLELEDSSATGISGKLMGCFTAKNVLYFDDGQQGVADTSYGDANTTAVCTKLQPPVAMVASTGPAAVATGPAAVATQLTVVASTSAQLTVVDGPSTIHLVNSAKVVEGGGKSHPLRFVLDVAAEGGSIVVTPKATGIAFSPLSVSVASGSNTSGPFHATAAPGTLAGNAVITAVLSGNASNIGTRLMVNGSSIDVSNSGGGGESSAEVTATLSS